MNAGKHQSNQSPEKLLLDNPLEPGTIDFTVEQGSLVAEILEHTSDGVFMLDYEWRFIYMNAHARDLVSTGANLIGRVVWDEFPAAHNLLFWDEYHRTMEERVPSQFSAHYPEPLNAWFEVHSYPTHRGISVFFRDITKRRAEEERLRLLEQAISSAPMGISIAEYKSVHECPIIYVNPAFEDLTGYSLQEVIGSDCRFLQGSELMQSGRGELQLAIAQHRPAKVVLRNYKKSGRRFFNEVHLSPVFDQHGNVSHIVGIQNDVTEYLETKARLARQAEYDSLTGLANRYLLTDRLKEALETAEIRGTQVAVVIFDLDNFKHMNDRLGHIEADRLLIQIAKRLNSVAEPGDTVGRLGGDEFALILVNWSDSARLHKQLERLLQEIRKPIRCGNQELIVTGSAGVATYPQDARDVEPLLQMADLSMYWIKRCGKNSFRLYSPELRFNDNEPLDVAVGFRKALANGEFELYYQPRVDTQTKRILGFEALIRWQHPQRGFLLPAQFIRIAEDTGLIHEIGSWALQHALEQNAAWRMAGLEPVVMSVNVSPAQIRDPDFPAFVEEALRATGLPASSLELELTESILIDNADLADSTLRALKQLGVRIAIDDFGAGCSGLHYLSSFPVDTIKVDHFFIRDIATNKTAAIICRSVLKLGQSLGLFTVAEGVETQDQVSLLRRWRCSELQGFMFAKPMQSEDAGRALANM
ncbi:putative bifunctional diguanylate cyclase/phosphodiesterase [Terriglobus roseus]|uniref:PAS domain S-box-containing protein/diguanylate cyclase (GGDEF) domain-containing protein n=1 Tax=Terriglobus roseus TaxID=392734 RepID=A0A1H4IWX2_9BACT|nr:EAL domain-containing protein [Terriglobus roseus]SEB38569.1 PAS domain S-box-containing protein/diguanylate cyclase (GGDEF) domain-containing protein [Terriglobus roseus]